MEFNQEQLDGLKASTLQAIAAAKEELKQKYDDALKNGAVAAELKTMTDTMMKRLDAVEAEMSRGIGNSYRDLDAAIDMPWERMVANDEVKAWASKPFHKGGTALKVKSFMEFPEFHPGYFKTTITSATVGSSTPGILVPERIPGIVKPGVRRVRVRDLIPRATTNNNAVEYVKENVYTNAGSPTAETISKPESALTFSIASQTVKTLAHWIPIAKQTLADFAELGGYVNTRLLEGLKDVEDNELVSGIGSGGHLDGLMHQAGTYDTSLTGSSDKIIDIIARALGQIEDVNLTPTGVIMNPRDWRAMRLVKTTYGEYILGGPQGTDPPSIWNQPVALTTAVPPSVFLVGAFASHSILFDRMDAQVALSTEHADFFIRNMVAVLAEERLALVVTRNDSVLMGTFPAGAY